MSAESLLAAPGSELSWNILRDITQTNIFVNWRALEAAGVDKNAPVTTRLRDVKFSKVLRTVLDEVGGGTVRLGYTIDEGVITISTESICPNSCFHLAKLASEFARCDTNSFIACDEKSFVLVSETACFAAES